MKKSTYLLPLILAAPLSAATVAVSYSNGFPTPVNLTTEGSLDWVQLGFDGTNPSSTARNEKAGATLISTVTRVDARNANFGSNGFSLNWTDGTGTAPLDSYSGVNDSWEAKPDTVTTTEASFVFSVDGLATGDYSLKLYGTSFQVAPILTASVGGVSNSFTANAEQDGVYTVNFSLDAGQSLQVSYAVNTVIGTAGNDRNVGIGAITLAPIPEPGTALLSLLGILGLIRRKR